MKNFSGKSSIRKYLYLLRDLNKRFPLCNIQSKSKESHMLVDLNNVQQTDITQPAWMHLRCIFWTSHTASQRHLKEG